MTDGSKVINREIFALWTGRFQPPHNGHFEILKHSIKILEVPHVAVLSSYFGWESKGVYGAHAEVAYEKSRNPLSTWERFWLMRLGLQSLDLLEQVSVIVAPRHDLDEAHDRLVRRDGGRQARLPPGPQEHADERRAELPTEGAGVLMRAASPLSS